MVTQVIFFPNIVFLIIIWEFHIMYPDHTSQLPDLPPKKEKKNLKTYKSSLCCPSTHRGVVTLPVARPLEKLSPSPPASRRDLPEALNWEAATLINS